jgi:RNA polymerase sigma-70 factor, ECF subfamily
VSGPWPESDITLVRRMLEGHASAFDDFFETAYPAVYRFALTRLGFDHDAAADVAQATICKAIRKLGTFRGEAALLTWLCTFCRHELYAYRRQHGTERRVELAEDDPEIRAALESLSMPGSEDLDAALDRDKVASLVKRALDYLPLHYSNALEWKYVDGMSVREIGGRLGLGPKAAESLLTRARHAFREAFQAIASAAPGLNRREETTP